MVAIILHEFGHAIVAKKLGYKLNKISLMPYGAELSGKRTMFLTRHEVLIALAGPLVNLFLIILTICMWWLFPIYYSYTEAFVIANLASLLFNLLPVFPLDGGRVLLGVLSSKIERKRALRYIKIIGIVISSIFLLFFIVSSFRVINFSFFIVSFFLMVGSLENTKNISYNSIITFAKVESLAKKPKPIKEIAISENATLLTAFKNLDYNCFNKFVILNEHLKTVKIINQIKLNEYLLIYKPTMTFNEIIK
jgi:stage IV sporulation protein FB